MVGLLNIFSDKIKLAILTSFGILFGSVLLDCYLFYYSLRQFMDMAGMNIIKLCMWVKNRTDNGIFACYFVFNSFKKIVLIIVFAQSFTAFKQFITACMDFALGPSKPRLDIFCYNTVFLDVLSYKFNQLQYFCR